METEKEKLTQLLLLLKGVQWLRGEINNNSIFVKYKEEVVKEEVDWGQTTEYVEKIDAEGNTYQVPEKKDNKQIIIKKVKVRDTTRDEELERVSKLLLEEIFEQTKQIKKEEN